MKKYLKALVGFSALMSSHGALATESKFVPDNSMDIVACGEALEEAASKDDIRKAEVNDVVCWDDTRHGVVGLNFGDSSYTQDKISGAFRAVSGKIDMTGNVGNNKDVSKLLDNVSPREASNFENAMAISARI